LVFAVNILNVSFATGTGAVPDNTILAVATLMLNDYSVAFEISGILLLAATIGAVVIGKGVKNSK
jgi:NADH-quinone oxidoreductase subunit J